jgi:hypothetical protein
MKKPKFFIDNARPVELEYILRVMPEAAGLRREDLLTRIAEKFSFQFQKRYFDSFNRLVDLGLLAKTKTADMETLHLTDQGKILKNILHYDVQLYNEIIHFLHYTGFVLSPSKKPYFWSYKCLTDLLWEKEAYSSNNELAGEISSYIQDNFETQITPFDGSTIQKFLAWLRVLDPPILVDKTVHRREIRRFELFLLSLDFHYQSNNLHYGDPILINAETIAQICKTFFASPNQFDHILKLAQKHWPHLRQTTAFQGLCLMLDKKYTIESLITV